ncbi:MAG TPA: NAD(P)-dependent oxidoreductase, partial [Pyrinomonadaceae bacterium]|nr:NAD(P)-dependent oxidoreductase [Pyrinomonadaceae bacterium]
MRVLIADKFEQSGRDGLEAAGCDYSFQPDVKDETLVEAIRSYRPDALVVRGTKVTEAMMDAGALKLIVRAGAGYNTIDVAAASRRGVYVSNCPGKNAVAVAELAMALVLALDRRIADNVIALREGRWDKKEFSKARGLYGRTLGLIGTGQIGQEVITRARAFGMRVVAWSRSLSEEKAIVLGVERLDSPAAVARESDVVSVHLALNPETRGLIDGAFFDAMKDGAYFVNTARGEVVDQPALVRALREKNIRAGLDVFAAEPTSATGEFTDEVAREPNLYGTHHVGGAVQAFDAEYDRPFVREAAAPGDDAHAEGARARDDLLPDLPGADEAQRATVEAARLRELFLVPAPFAERDDVVGDSAVEREDERQRQLGDGDGVLAGAVRDVDAAARGRRHVNRVVARARAHDELQGPRVHHRLCHLRPAHDERFGLVGADGLDERRVLHVRLVRVVAARGLKPVAARLFELIGNQHAHDFQASSEFLKNAGCRASRRAGTARGRARSRRTPCRSRRPASRSA